MFDSTWLLLHSIRHDKSLPDQSEQGISSHCQLHPLNNIIPGMVEALVLENKHTSGLGVDIQPSVMVVGEKGGCPSHQSGLLVCRRLLGGGATVEIEMERVERLQNRTIHLHREGPVAMRLQYQS